MNWSGSVNDSIEAIVLIGSVVDSSDWTIRFDQGVGSLNNISVASFVLWLNITCMVVVDAVFEGILRVGLG